jgi:hypothetical protein
MAASSGVTIRPGNQFFDRLPEDVQRSAFEFLKKENADDKAVIATAAVCKNWRDNASLRGERAASTARLSNSISNRYPPEIVQVFQNSGPPISRLPVLALGNRRGCTDYIDFIEPADMRDSVMRFQDVFGRPGIAFKIRFRGDDVVLTIFKRYADGRKWVHAWGGGHSFLERHYNKRHKENSHTDSPHQNFCPTCPFVMGSIVHPAVLSGLLNGTDPDFSLPGHRSVLPASPAIAGNSEAS